ncbi:DUF106 domain-containing protein [Natrinema caseinilyticum]|uniref:DUF106 domain-containing protein n=1 Tax=Natrinema caseinilyticum TaxID=2961570 RepID=UPI0020C4CE08|nr:DUF106 domain-containing protein [Natrinema caseinilyticum]
MPAEQLGMLLESDVTREALSVIFERTDEGNEEIRWEDVSDTVSSSQWGRLLSQDILVSGSSGFVLANSERVRRALEEDETEITASRKFDELDPESWKWYDKVAGLVTLILFMGYWNSEIRNIVASLDNVFLGPLTDIVPFYAVVILLAVVTGLYSTVLQSWLMDHEKMEAYRERMSDLSERRTAAKERGDDEELKRIREEQMEAAGDNLGMFKLQFRPMVWTMLLTIPVFLWLRWKIRGGHLTGGEMGMVFPIAGPVRWQEAVFGFVPAWIFWYFLCSMASRQMIRKLFADRLPAPA